MTNSYKKGGRTERKIYKRLGSFYFNNEKSFARLKGESQGMRPGDIGIYLKDNQAATLQLITDFPFTIEIKNREEWNYKKLIEYKGNTKPNIWDYWEQAKNQAERAKKCPLLIYKKNYYKFMAALPYSIENNCIRTDYFKEEIDSYKIPKYHTITTNSNEYIIIFRFMDFLSINKKCNNVNNLKEKYNKLMEKYD